MNEEKKWKWDIGKMKKKETKKGEDESGWEKNETGKKWKIINREKK